MIDTVPRPEFSQYDSLNLLDLGTAISNLIRERKNKANNSNKDNAKL